MLTIHSRANCFFLTLNIKIFSHQSAINLYRYIESAQNFLCDVVKNSHVFWIYTLRHETFISSILINNIMSYASNMHKDSEIFRFNREMLYQMICSINFRFIDFCFVCHSIRSVIKSLL